MVDSSSCSFQIYRNRRSIGMAQIKMQQKLIDLQSNLNIQKVWGFARHIQNIDRRRNLAELDGNPTISQNVPIAPLPKFEQKDRGIVEIKSDKAVVAKAEEQVKERSEYFLQSFREVDLVKNLVFQHQYRVIFMDVYLPMLVRNEFKNLIQLGINQCNFGNSGCKILSKAELPMLEKLGLIENGITTEGVTHLSKLPLKNLRQLYLGSNKITSGLPILIKLTIPRIQYINLQNNSVLPCEFQWILISRFNKLKMIDLTWNRIENLKEKAKKKEQFYMRYRNCALTC